MADQGRLVVDMFMTIDQVMQAPGQRTEDIEGGFEHGGWQAPFASADTGEVITQGIERMDALLLGRKTYDIFAGYWPSQTGRIADRLNAIPKYVASRSLTKLTWQGTTVLHNATEIAALKGNHSEIHLIGSGDLLQTLLAEDLVDVLNLWVYPVILGSGKRVFRDGAVPAAFQLSEPPVAYDNGTMQLTYRRAGEVGYGDMSSS